MDFGVKILAAQGSKTLFQFILMNHKPFVSEALLKRRVWSDDDLGIGFVKHIYMKYTSTRVYMYTFMFKQ